jgi:hypothetical protein
MNFFASPFLVGRRFVMAVQSAFSSKETACVGDLLNVCDGALALIHERCRLFEVLRATPIGEEREDTLNAALEKLHHLERVSNQIEVALCDVMRLADSAGGIGARGKRSAELLHHSTYLASR